MAKRHMHSTNINGIESILVWLVSFPKVIATIHARLAPILKGIMRVHVRILSNPFVIDSVYMLLLSIQYHIVCMGWV